MASGCRSRSDRLTKAHPCVGRQEMAWWVHDHLPYSSLCFFKHRAAFNIQWSEKPERRIASFVPTYGVLTKPGMVGHDDDHADLYSDFSVLRG